MNYATLTNLLLDDDPCAGLQRHRAALAICELAEAKELADELVETPNLLIALARGGHHLQQLPVRIACVRALRYLSLGNDNVQIQIMKTEGMKAVICWSLQAEVAVLQLQGAWLISNLSLRLEILRVVLLRGDGVLESLYSCYQTGHIDLVEATLSALSHLCLGEEDVKLTIVKYQPAMTMIIESLTEKSHPRVLSLAMIALSSLSNSIETTRRELATIPKVRLAAIKAMDGRIILTPNQRKHLTLLVDYAQKIETPNLTTIVDKLEAEQMQFYKEEWERTKEAARRFKQYVKDIEL